MAIGKVILKFTLNLSDILQPCVLVATIVVSDINDRLSPNIAPLTTTPNISASGIPVLLAMPTATGDKATIVPTDVPTDMEIKQAAINTPAASKLPGRIYIVRLTVASMMRQWKQCSQQVRICW